MNPDTKNSIPSNLITPSPDKYKVPDDNIYFKKNKIAQVNEKKFFELTNMPKIRAQVPVQYCGIDGVSANKTVDLSD